MIGAVSEDIGTAIAKSHIPAYNYFDTTFTVDIAKKFTLRMGVQNMLDTDPPVVGGSAGSAGTNSGNTFPQVYDPLGRTYFAGVSAKF